MKVASPEAAEFWQEKAADSTFGGELFKLEKIEGVTANPAPSAENFRDAGLVLNGEPETIHEQMTELDLLHLLEIQRRMKFPLRPGYPACHWVGGLALLTTITKDCVTQRVIYRWKEDEIGKVITPAPIDWSTYRAERMDPHAEAIGQPELSKLQRDMRERKNRKLQRRLRVVGGNGL